MNVRPGTDVEAFLDDGRRVVLTGGLAGGVGGAVGALAPTGGPLGRLLLTAAIALVLAGALVLLLGDDGT